MTPLPTRENNNTVRSSLVPPKLNQVNNWLNWFQPADWQTAVGPDGAVISPDLTNLGAPMMMIRRWGSPVDLSGWQSYIPDGEVEPNGHVSVVMGGRHWNGVFILCPEYTCRAFFAATTEEAETVSYSLLVYVPSSIDLSSTADPQKTLYDLWDIEAGKLNATLHSLNISE